MAEEIRQLTTYKLGDTIRIELEVKDRSGVGHIVAFFRSVDDETKYIRLVGDGDGQTTVTVRLEQMVTEDVAPGEYLCSWVEMYDMRGNRNVVPTMPDFRFRIEGVPGDHEGPELSRWQVISPEGIPSEEAFGEATIGEPPIQRPQEEA